MQSTSDTIELIRFLDDMRKDIESSKATIALVSQQIIELRNDLNDFRQDIISYRAIRAQAEIGDLEARMKGTQSRVDVLKTGGGTDERIKKAVEAEIKKRGIDWKQVVQVTVQAVAGALAVGITLTIFWQIIKVLALNAP